MSAVGRGDMICDGVSVFSVLYVCMLTCQHTYDVCVCLCKCVSMSSEPVFTVKAWHVQPHKELIGSNLSFNRDFLVEIEKCFRCF